MVWEDYMIEAMNSRDTSCLTTLHLASLVHPIFGNGTSVKCVVNEHGDTVFVKDASLLLQLLAIEHPVGQLIVSVCSAHSHRYGCGVKSLLVMLGQLTGTYLTLHDMGIPAPVVITLMRRVLGDCEKMLREVHIPLSHFPLPSANIPEHKCISHTADSGFFETMTMADVGSLNVSKSQVPTDNQHRTLNDSESKDGPLLETKFVHLKMKDEDDDADEDDIEWFFDRCIPESNIEAIVTDSVGEIIKQTHRRKMDEPELICSLKDTDQHDSDFDDCFDEGLTKQNIKLSVDIDSGPDLVKTLTDHFNETKYTKQEATMIKSALFGNDLTQTKEHETFSQKGSEVGDDQKVDMNWFSESKISGFLEDEFDSCFDDCGPGGKPQFPSADVKGKSKNDQITIANETVSVKMFKDSCKESLNILTDTVKTADRPGVLLSSRHLKHDTLSDPPPTSQCKDQMVNAMTQGNKEQELEIPLRNKYFEKSKDKFAGSEIEKLNKMLFEVNEKKKTQSHVTPSGNSSSHSQSRTENSDPVSGHQSSNLSIQNLNDMLETVNRKQKVTSHTTLLNSSRHFKTFESSVAAMKESKSKDSSFSNISEFEHNLHKRLAEKKKQTLNASLSHSRHFKSLDNVTISGVQSDIKHSETVIEQATLSCLETYPLQHSHVVPIRSDLNHEETNQRDALTHKESANGESRQSSKEEENLLQEDSTKKLSSKEILGTADRLSSNLSTRCPMRKTVRVHDAAKGLSHGSEAGMELVLQAAKTQMLKTALNQFNVKLVHTCTVTGPASKHTAVVPGLVFECETDLVSRIISSNRKHWNTLLVNGDLSPSYHHHGYKTAAKGSRVIGPNSLAMSSVQHGWIHDCQQILQELTVDLILVRGQAESKVKDRLQSVGILTVERVPYRVLEAVRETMGTELTVYVTDCNMRHVCDGLTVQPYSSDWCDKITRGQKQTTHVVVNTLTSSTWQTLVLCHPSSMALDIQEQEVQVCSHRLATALHDGIVLPGAGATERFCSQYLLNKCNENHNITNDLGLYQPVVMESMAEMFDRIVSLVETNKSLSLTTNMHQSVCQDGLTRPDAFCENEVNMSNNITTTEKQKTKSEELCFPNVCNTCNRMDCSNCVARCNDTQIFDNYTSKMAAWSAAMDTVAMVTQTDAQIVTGVTSDDVRKNGVFINGVIL